MTLRKHQREFDRTIAGILSGSLLTRSLGRPTICGCSRDSVVLSAVPPPLSPSWETRYQSSSPEPFRSGQVRAKVPRLDQKTRASAGLVRAVRAVRAKFIIYTHAHTRARVCPHLSFYHFFSIIKESALTTLTRSINTSTFTLTGRPDLP